MDDKQASTRMCNEVHCVSEFRFTLKSYITRFWNNWKDSNSFVKSVWLVLACLIGNLCRLNIFQKTEKLPSLRNKEQDRSFLFENFYLFRVLRILRTFYSKLNTIFLNFPSFRHCYFCRLQSKILPTNNPIFPVEPPNKDAIILLKVFGYFQMCVSVWSGN